MAELWLHIRTSRPQTTIWPTPTHLPPCPLRAAVDHVIYAEKNRIWKPQHKGLRNFILRIPSGLGPICWAEDSQDDFFQKRAVSGGESER